MSEPPKHRGTTQGVERKELRAALYDHEVEVRKLVAELKKLKPSRELSLAITNIEQGGLWLRTARDVATIEGG